MHPTATGPSPVTHGDPLTTSPIQPATNHSVGQSPSHPHGESLVRGPAIDESRVQLATGDAVPASFKDLSWQDRLAHIEDTMREVSKETHPQAMVKAYARRMRGTIEPGHTISLSRRDLPFPQVRITRSTLWKEQLDPWKERDRLPLLSGGFFSDVAWADKPLIFPTLNIPQDDPAYPYLSHAKSLIVIPHYEHGVGLNVVVHTAFRENAFDVDKFPELVLQSNLFGRGTKNLVLARDLREAYEQIDAELKSVQDIQLSLLPRETPNIPSLELAAYYQTSKRAGGDYYDFFPLPNNQWAILVADVSGHGTPAAVLMAILHAIAHLMPGDVSARAAGRIWEPHEAMSFVNRALSERYTRETGAFVTMLYGIWDENTKTLRYANAGHPAPVVRDRDSTVRNDTFEDVGVPLGILADAEYGTRSLTLESGQALILYTDGITEAFNTSHDMFGEARMFDAIRRGFACCTTTHPDARSPHAPQPVPMYGELAPQDLPGSASGILNAIVDDLGKFAGLASRSDDRTLVVASVR